MIERDTMKDDMMTINRLAKLAGISVRTLHYYDETDLLKPALIQDNGYRLYDEESLKTLQQILFFRELEFSLKQIKQIMSSESFDETEALFKHKELLKAKRDRLNGLISLVDKTLRGQQISLKEFDMTEIEKQRRQYAEEVKQRWGQTAAYKQSEARTKKYTKEDWSKIEQESSDIFKAFAACMREEKGSKNADELVRAWQAHISKYYYDCTDEILLGLSEMYIADERFKQNIDMHADGLAEFISNSIKDTLK